MVGMKASGFEEACLTRLFHNSSSSICSSTRSLVGDGVWGLLLECNDKELS